MNSYSTNYTPVICISLQLIGELLTTDDSESDLFWEHVRVNDYFLNTLTNMVLINFPFLRFFPGKYGYEFRRGKAVNAKIAKRYFHDVKVILPMLFCQCLGTTH